MFVYILKDYQRYPLSSIKEVYCYMPIYFDSFNYEEETPEETTNRINRSRIENYLNKISEKILNNKSFLALKEFNTF